MFQANAGDQLVLIYNNSADPTGEPVTIGQTIQGPNLKKQPVGYIFINQIA